MDIMEKDINAKLTKEEMETLKTILDKLRDEKPKIDWKATCRFLRGDGYYYVSQDGNVCRSSWQFGKADWCKFHLNNTFKTEKEAELELEKRKIIEKLKRYSKWCWEQFGMSEKEAWNSVDSKFSLIYQTMKKEIVVFNSTQHKRVDGIYFPTIEDAKKAIEIIGEKNLKKYAFGVEA